MPGQPNILFFFTDQQRWDTCGCYGNPMGLTPNLDRLAAEGVKFEYAFTNQPVCGPARALLQTGKYATQTGCHRNGIALGEDETTIARQFSAAGYEVGYIGKWHLASNNRLGDDEKFVDRGVPERRRGGYKDFWLAADLLEFSSHPDGGTIWDGEGNPVEFEGYRVDTQTDWVLDYLRTRDGKRPWFLFLSYLEPHHQNDMNRYVAPPGYAEKYKDCVVPGDLQDLDGDWREQLPDYYGIVADIDENLGRIRDELERTGQLDNTVIVFTTDHGSHFRTRNSEYKRACHDGCLRIPMVLWGPNLKKGKKVEELVSLIDLPPTLMELGGAEIPPTMAGRSLLPLVRDESTDWPDDVYVEISEAGVGRAVRTHRWTYCVECMTEKAALAGTSDAYREAYLYDNDADPHQHNNLIADADYEEIRQTLKQRLLDHMEDVEGKRAEILPPNGDGQ